MTNFTVGHIYESMYILHINDPRFYCYDIKYCLFLEFYLQ